MSSIPPPSVASAVTAITSTGISSCSNNDNTNDNHTNDSHPATATPPPARRTTTTSTNTTRNKEEEEEDHTMVEPCMEDVLCGRGGMSNHHPGNEWYRRLIRSNRALYRACPKHTKLLVAKAIVQAVQEQNGRFLERDLTTGQWYSIPYKRAVDKTSQGLREKDREVDGPPAPAASKSPSSKAASRGKSSNKTTEEDHNEETTHVPYAFSGQGSSQPHLSDLAQVAVQNTKPRKQKKLPTIANRAQELFPATAPPPAAASSSSSLKAPPVAASNSIATSAVVVAPPLHHNSSSMSTTTTDHHEALAPGAYAYWVQQQQQQMQQQQQQQQPPQQGNNSGNNEASSSMQQAQLLRDVSMYGLLKHTQLLPGQTSMLLQMNQSGGSLTDVNHNINYNHNNNSSSSTDINNHHVTGVPQFNQSDLSASEMMIMMNQQGHAPNNINHPMNRLYPYSSNAGGQPLDPGHPHPHHDNDHHNHASSSSIGATTATNTNATMPVGLTRLTSQVSDWLNFFWPNSSHNPQNDNIGAGGSNNNNNEPPHQQQQQQQQQHLNNSQNHVAATTLYERQRSAEAAALRAMASAHAHRTGDMLPPPPQAAAGAAAPVNPPPPPNQQQQQQQQSSDIESLIQLHHQLSSEIDSTPFTSLFHSNSFFSPQTSLPFLLPVTSNEQPPPSDHVRNDDSHNNNNSNATQRQQPHVASSNKRQSQDRDEEGTASTTNQPPHHPTHQHYRSYRIPVPPVVYDDRPSKQPKLSHHWNATNDSTGDYNYSTVRNGNDDDDRKPAGRSSAAAGVMSTGNLRNNTNAPAALSSAPSELEQSVSLTLLKLAESPSNLFSGLTSFFGANPSTMLVNNNHQQNQRSRGSNILPLGQQQQRQQYPSYESTLIHSQQHQQQPEQVHAPAMIATAVATVDNTTGQQRKSQSSLLDDVEETPMEQRMRSLHQYA